MAARYRNQVALVGKPTGPMFYLPLSPEPKKLFTFKEICPCSTEKYNAYSPVTVVYRGKLMMWNIRMVQVFLAHYEVMVMGHLPENVLRAATQEELDAQPTEFFHQPIDFNIPELLIYQ